MAFTATLIVAILSAQDVGVAGAFSAQCQPAPGEDGQDWAVLRCAKPAAGWQTMRPH